jgi:hypothetical protein
MRDVRMLMGALIWHSRAPRFDLNRDGRVNTLDLVEATRQLGRRC